jgi:uncharacterized NAD(P)/FAD-binding protein YdhS
MKFSNQHPYHVAVVGAGFSGALVAVHLSKLAPRWRVLVIDKAGAFGRGVAYNTSDTRHLLNVPAGKLSAFADQPDHFLKWLQEHRAEFSALGIKNISGDSFLSRKLYGQYVRDLFEHSLIVSRFR